MPGVRGRRRAGPSLDPPCDEEAPTMHDWTLPHSYQSSLGQVRWNRIGDHGAPLVLLHGTPFSSLIWHDIAPGLATEHQVFVWDMPGYGSSESGRDQELSLAALTRVFVELLDHWQLTAPLVVAHDSGGALALGAHLDHARRFPRLALVDAVALGPWGSSFSQLAGAHQEVFAALPGPLHAALLGEYVDSASGPGLHPSLRRGLIAPWLGGEGQAAFYRQLAQRAHDDAYTTSLRDRYSTIELPMLICWGADDGWIPPDRGRELASMVPAARFHLLPHAGHLLPCDRPGELAVRLTSFLHDAA
jgi:pimeloyl-ACP methyl ester carboxylesterase